MKQIRIIIISIILTIIIIIIIEIVIISIIVTTRLIIIGCKLYQKISRNIVYVCCSLPSGHYEPSRSTF